MTSDDELPQEMEDKLKALIAMLGAAMCGTFLFEYFMCLC